MVKNHIYILYQAGTFISFCNQQKTSKVTSVCKKDVKLLF